MYIHCWFGIISSYVWVCAFSFWFDFSTVNTGGLREGGGGGARNWYLHYYECSGPNFCLYADATPHQFNVPVDLDYIKTLLEVFNILKMKTDPLLKRHMCCQRRGRSHKPIHFFTLTHSLNWWQIKWCSHTSWAVVITETIKQWVSGRKEKQRQE